MVDILSTFLDSLAFVSNMKVLGKEIAKKTIAYHKFCDKLCSKVSCGQKVHPKYFKGLNIFNKCFQTFCCKWHLSGALKHCGLLSFDLGHWIREEYVSGLWWWFNVNKGALLRMDSYRCVQLWGNIKDQAGRPLLDPPLIHTRPHCP